MSKKEKPGMGQNLKEVLKIIRKIAKKAASGNYIYRGESKENKKVSSGLYRYLDRKYGKKIKMEGLDIEFVQKEGIIEEAWKYVPGEEEFEVLAQIQHHGGKTNLIDFTTDYLKALYFACEGYPRKKGRIILLNRNEENEKEMNIKSPRNPRNRVIAQSSVFVRPPKGFIEPGRIIIIPIPWELKKAILEHLRKCHGISSEVIYNDLHGFITKGRIREGAYMQFFKGLTIMKEGLKDE